MITKKSEFDEWDASGQEIIEAVHYFDPFCDFVNERSSLSRRLRARWEGAAHNTDHQKKSDKKHKLMQTRNTSC